MAHSTGSARRAETVRYLVAIVIGLAFDVGTGFFVHARFGLSLPLSSAVGIAVGVAVNYLLFETFVFRTRAFTLLRLAKTYASALLALAVRVACVVVLERWLGKGDWAALATLVLAAGVSSVVNYLVVRRMLAGRAPPA